MPVMLQTPVYGNKVVPSRFHSIGVLIGLDTPDRHLNSQKWIEKASYILLDTWASASQRQNECNLPQMSDSSANQNYLGLPRNLHSLPSNVHFFPVSYYRIGVNKGNLFDFATKITRKHGATSLGSYHECYGHCRCMIFHPLSPVERMVQKASVKLK